MRSKFGFGKAVRRFTRGLANQLNRDGKRAPSPEWRKRLLRFVHRYAPSDTPGPFPTAILLHGCNGDKEHLARWGRLLAQHGFLVYTIDSLSPREIGPIQARCFVCTGLMLQGKERSRDLTEIMSFALQDPMVDRGRINLIGWSHGAWTILEWMLDNSSTSAATHPDVSAHALVLNYPYCGLASMIHEKEWRRRIPIMITTAGRDCVVPNKKTFAFGQTLLDNDVPVTQLHFASVGHAFDVEGSPQYNADSTATLQAAVIEFMQTANSSQPPAPT